MPYWHLESDVGTSVRVGVDDAAAAAVVAAAVVVAFAASLAHLLHCGAANVVGPPWRYPIKWNLNLVVVVADLVVVVAVFGSYIVYDH